MRPTGRSGGRHIRRRPLPIRDALNEHAGATFTDEQIEDQLANYVQFTDPTIAAEETYNPDSSLYWKKSLDFYAEQNIAGGDLSEGTDLDILNQQENIYKSVLENEELMDWVNSPLT